MLIVDLFAGKRGLTLGLMFSLHICVVCWCFCVIGGRLKKRRDGDCILRSRQVGRIWMRVWFVMKVGLLVMGNLVCLCCNCVKGG